jgi:hypothetical protein
MANVKINQKVKTPLGEGFVQGQFAVLDAQTEALISKGIAVRLPVNELTQSHLKDSSCLTSHATLSGVWVFQESELQ